MISILILLGLLTFFGLVINEIFWKRPDLVEQEIQNLKFPKALTWTIAIILIGYNLFYYDMSFEMGANIGIGFGLFNLTVILGLLFAYPKHKRKPLIYIISLFSILIGFTSAIRANEFIQEFNTALTRITLLVLALLYIIEPIKWEGLWIIKTLWKTVKKTTRHVEVTIKAPFRNKQTKKLRLISIIKTAAITVVTIAFFAGLLSQADPIFEELIADILDEAAGRTIVSILLTILLAFVFSLHVKADENDSPKFKILSFYDISVPVIGMVLLFGFFLLIQAKYLFGAGANFEQFDLTYSDYVRKGFIELLVASFFGSLVVYIVILKTKVLEKIGGIRFMKALNAFLILELFAVLGSALQRDLLYVDVYGLTRIRLIGGVFLACLAAFLGLLLVLNLTKQVREKYLFGGTLIIAMLATLTLNYFNMDQVIASADPPEGNYKDYYYINNLSSDAIDGWEESIIASSEYFDTIFTQRNIDEEELSHLADTKLALIALQNSRDDLREKFEEEEDVIAYWNLSEWKAYLRMEENTEEFDDTLNCLVTQIENYQIYNDISLYEEEDNRIWDYEYPLVRIDKSYYPAYSQVQEYLNDRINESDILEQAKSLYGEYHYYTYEDLELNEYGIFDDLIKEITPKSCTP